jgi:DNA primase
LKKSIEEFFKNNVQEMIENKKKLFDAKEEYKKRKLEYLCKKELCYEMDPFIWELVKCDDGSTKVKIIQENDKDIIRIRNYEELQLDEADELFEEEAEEKCETSLLSFEDRRKIIDEFSRDNINELKKQQRKNSINRKTKCMSEKIALSSS